MWREERMMMKRSWRKGSKEEKIEGVLWEKDDNEEEDMNGNNDNVDNDNIKD